MACARLKLPLADVKPAILGHAEFAAFQQKATQGFAVWRRATTPRLTSFDKDGHPKARHLPSGSEVIKIAIASTRNCALVSEGASA